MKQTRNIGCLLILGAVLLLSVALIIKSWRIYQATQSLLAQQSQVETLLAGGLTNINPDEAEALVMDIRRDVKIIKDETAVFMPFTPLFGWVPKAGPLIVAAPHLIEMADGGTEAAAYAVRGLKPALVLLQDENTTAESRLPDMLQIIANAQADLRQADAAMERVIAARQALGDDTSALPWRIHTLLEQADPYLELGGSSFDLLTILPDLMGHNGRRQYLILAQNEDEIRATGGFISGVGIMTVENGRLVGLAFEDAYTVDDWQNKPYDFPPQPLYDHMGLELFLFRDVNYWPDFPTSAQKAMDLYSYGRDYPPLDGTIAIDQQFVKALVAATGPITIAGTDVVLNANNIIANFQQAWALQEGQEISSWFGNRKAFLGIFGAAIQDKLFNQLSDIDPVLLIKNMSESAQSNHLQIYLRDPQAAAVLDELGWNGRLHNETGQDVLLALDTNMGYNKANYLIERQTEYQVDLTTRQASLALLYQHSGEADGQPCQQWATYNAEEVVDYFNIVNACYFNFLRLYTPPNSQLLSATTHAVPAEWRITQTAWHAAAEPIQELPDFATFATFLVVAQGETAVTNFRYQLPDTIIHDLGDGRQQYHLALYKQAGSKPETVNVTITLPPDATLLTAVPTPVSTNNNQLTFNLSLVEDSAIVVTYR